jgi:serine/threonine protein kinase
MTTAGLMPGGAQPESIGKYRIVERIGRGAMGVVYSAIDEQLDRHVAVKLMLADFDQEPELRERFYREARITGQLAHRNIVTVFDLGDHNGRPYIVMELLNGLSLADHLQQLEAHDIDAKIDLMMQVCDGLQNAHRSGVIHRDLKPSNMFVQRGGVLKILDFGVARLTASNLTASGFLVGTPEYMAPEQPQGRTVDARSDVYSAASVFYFMLTGRSPFGSRDLMRMLDAILNETPPPLTEEEAPEALRRVLGRALSKAPEGRQQHCGELLEDLARARRTYHATTYRVIQAALERYRQTLAAIDERRVLGRSLGRVEGDAECDEAIRRLQSRFPAFARAANGASLLEPMDRVAAHAALELLQTRHNAEVAAVAAMREEAAGGRQRSRADADSWTNRAASFVRGLLPPRDGSPR